LGTFINIAGQRFGRLTVSCIADRDKWKNIRWSCICDCGHKTIVLGGALRQGRINNCGCSKIRHGHSKQGNMTQIYIAWMAMKQRCVNLNNPEYKNYGARNITICFRWKVFENFLADMGEPPTENHSLDRINNDGNYCPENCRWATKTEQARNMRVNHLITYRGKTQCLPIWAEQFGISENALRTRLRVLGWSIEKALTTPIKRYKKRKING